MVDLKVSVIIPCYFEEQVIGETYKRLKRVLTDGGYSGHELLFIDDGSQDNTLQCLEGLAAGDRHVKIISFSRNFGHQCAVSAGINSCSGDVAVIIDADLQDPPELIPEMIKKMIDEKCNVVYGARMERKGESIGEKLSAKLFYRFLNYLSDVPLPLDTGDFRLIDRKIIEQFRKLNEKNRYIRGLISWLGFKQIPFYYSRDPRFGGETKYSITKMLKLAGTGLQYFSKKPLRIAISIGFFSIFVGIMLAIWVIAAKLSNTIETVTGWTSMLIVVIFFGGVQLLTIGVLGSYIGSIFDEVKNRPEYVIARKINFED